MKLKTDINLNMILAAMQQIVFPDKEIIHALAIILRAQNEMEYMLKNNVVIPFSLNQMDGFSISHANGIWDLCIGTDCRFRLSSYTLNRLTNEIYDFLENKFPIAYDLRKIDPIFFSLFFYDVLDKIEGISYDTVSLDDFRMLRMNSEAVPLEETEQYKALVDGNYNRFFTPFASNHIIDSEMDRMKHCLASIREYNYPYKEQYIILYNDEMFIRDGQHRAEVLKYLYGNIAIPVVRFHLKNSYFYD